MKRRWLLCYMLATAMSCKLACSPYKCRERVFLVKLLHRNVVHHTMYQTCSHIWYAYMYMNLWTYPYIVYCVFFGSINLSMSARRRPRHARNVIHMYYSNSIYVYGYEKLENGSRKTHKFNIHECTKQEMQYAASLQQLNCAHARIPSVGRRAWGGFCKISDPHAVCRIFVVPKMCINFVNVNAFLGWTRSILQHTRICMSLRAIFANNTNFDGAHKNTPPPPRRKPTLSSCNSHNSCCAATHTHVIYSY